MPSTYTVNLGIEKPATGEQSGTWGDTVNDNSNILDEAINGVVSITLASAGSSGSPNSITITNGALSTGRNKWIEFTDGGDLGAAAYVQLTPNDAEKICFIRNSLTASRSIFLFQGTYNASNDLEIAAGTDVVVKFNGGGTGATVVNVYANLKVDGIVATTADINGGTVDGTVIGGAAAAALTATTVVANTSLNIAGTTTISSVLDEDNMASDSATALATQQSIKAYVDSQVGTVDTLSEILANGNTTGATDIDVDGAQKVQFRDAAIYINSSVDGQLDIVADTEIQIAATTIDINGAIVASGDISAASLDISGNVDIDGITNLDVVDIDGAVQIDAALTVGVDDTGYDVKFFGATGGKYMLWNQATDTLDVVGSIEFDSLSGTGAVAITDIKDEDNMASDSATALATQQSIKAYVDAQVGTVDTLAEVLANGNTTGGTNISFGDDDKAVFGAGSDLQIYHDGANSFIYEGGTGSLKIQAVNLNLQSTTGESYIDAVNNGSVYIYYDNSAKLSTTATGIDVTGTATMDGLTVDGSSSGTLNNVNFLNTNAGATTTATRIGLGITNSAGAAYTYIEANEGGVDSYPHLNFYTGSSATKRLEIADNGDLSLYENTGTTPKFFWDASAESLGIGTTSPATALDARGGVNGAHATFTGQASRGLVISTANTLSNDDGVVYNAQTVGSGKHIFQTAGTERMRIDNDGNVKIGDSSTDITSKLTVSGNASSDVATFMYDGSAGTFLDIDCAGANGAVNLRADARTGAYPPLLFTTGSTEAMRIDASGNLGLGVTPSAWNSGYKAMQLLTGALYGTSSRDTNLGANVFVNAGGGYAYIQSSFATNYTQFNGAHSWYTAPSGTAGNAITFTQAMTLDASGNVGIGTSSPDAPLKIDGGSTVNTVLHLTSGTANTYLKLSDSNTTNGGFIGYATEDMFLLTNNTERMRINALANVSIGSSFASGVATRVLTVDDPSNAAIVVAHNGATALNLYADSDEANIGSYLEGANMNFFTTPSGGSVTERMRITSGGALEIGPTANKVIIKSQASFQNTTLESHIINADGTGAYGSGDLLIQPRCSNVGSNNIVFGTSGGTNTTTERMRIDASGNLYCSGDSGGTILTLTASSGTTSGDIGRIRFGNNDIDSNLVNIVGYQDGATDSGGLKFETQPTGGATTERMRIDASGNLLVGTTAAVGKFSIEATPTGTARSVDYSATGGTVDYYIVDNVNVGSISVTTTATAYNTSSDARLKENIADAESASELIDAIQVRSFDWKADGSHQDYGMVAQELMTVAPEAVSVPEDPEKMMGVDYSKLVPMLIKEVQSLRARIAALES
jgi:hypothetical protein